MPIYMNYEGIKGEVTESKHKDWIEVNSFSFGLGRGISTPVGNARNREASTPSVSEVTITKPFDGTSGSDLITAALKGAGKTVKFDFVKTEGDGATESYLYIELTDTMVSGYSMSGGGMGNPSESISLNFSKVMVKGYDRPTSGKGAGTPKSITYDLAQAKTV